VLENPESRAMSISEMELSRDTAFACSARSLVKSSSIESIDAAVTTFGG
jgi:hypothetical protein